MNKTKEDFRRAALAKFPNNKAELEEYIEEAEHQEGSTYWINDSVSGWVWDFHLYLEATNDYYHPPSGV